jgi:hypothetical protein
MLPFRGQLHAANLHLLASSHAPTSPPVHFNNFRLHGFFRVHVSHSSLIAVALVHALICRPYIQKYYNSDIPTRVLHVDTYNFSRAVTKWDLLSHSCTYARAVAFCRALNEEKVLRGGSGSVCGCLLDLARV